MQFRWGGPDKDTIENRDPVKEEEEEE